MRITIPPIPPFHDTWANFDNSSDGDDDFISVLESRLEGDVEVTDFVLQFEEELERTLASEGSLHSLSFMDATPPFFDNNLFDLYNIDKDENNYNNDRQK